MYQILIHGRLTQRKGTDLLSQYLFHKIGLNKSDKTRYSLALNFIPSKGFGMHDSHINL